MDRPEVKRRVAISYIVTAVCLIAILLFTQFFTMNRSTDNAEETDDTVSDTSDEEVSSETNEDAEETPDSYETLETATCTYDGYCYRMITDADELSAWGLPETITDDIVGGTFATADDQTVLYAYPAYGCRAVLIAGKDNARSFCVLDGFTDDTKASTLDAILPMYGIHAVSNILSAQIVTVAGTEIPLDSEEITQLCEFFSACSNAGDKAAVTDAVAITFTTQSGMRFSFSYYEDLELISVFNEYYQVTDDLKDWLTAIGV